MCFYLDNIPIRAEEEFPLSMHILWKTLDQTDPIQSKYLILETKFIAEPDPDELKTLLGWILYTINLLISLLEDKWIYWSSIIR